MILVIECVILCIVFTLIILPVQYKDPMVMIMSYPPNVIKRVEQLPQYAGCIKEREKKHIAKKIFGFFFFAIILAIIAYVSGCREFVDTFIHVFMICWCWIGQYSVIVKNLESPVRKIWMKITRIIYFMSEVLLKALLLE